MADKLSVQNALTQLLKENKNILKNGQTLIDALFERADMSFVDRKIYEKAFVDANIGEIFLIETIETANEQAYSKLKRIMQERRALDVLEPYRLRCITQIIQNRGRMRRKPKQMISRGLMAVKMTDKMAVTDMMKFQRIRSRRILLLF